MLRLPPGFYRAGGLQLPAYSSISGVAGATRIVMAGGPSMLSATGSDHVSITGIVLDARWHAFRDQGLELYPGQARELADNSATKQQHADDEAYALDDQHPLAEGRQIVLHGNDDESPDHGPEHCAKSTQ